MRITEYYIISGGAEFLNDHTVTLQTVLRNLLGEEMKPRGLAYVALVIEALLRSFPIEGGLLFRQCGLLKLFLEACAANYWEQDDSEPDRVIVLYLTALSRILLANSRMVESLLPMTSQSGAVFGENELVSMFITKFQVGGNGGHGLLFQKLWYVSGSVEPHSIHIILLHSFILSHVLEFSYSFLPCRAMLLLSFYPPCQTSSFSNAVLERSNEIFTVVVYVLRNVNADRSNILSYDVGYDDEEETVEIGADMYDSLLLGLLKKV